MSVQKAPATSGVRNQFAEPFQWLQPILKEAVSWNNLSWNLLFSPSSSLRSLLNSSELNFLQIILYLSSKSEVCQQSSVTTLLRTLQDRITQIIGFCVMHFVFYHISS